MTPDDRNVLRDAANFLRDHADALFDCHTVNRKWPKAEAATRREYNRQYRIVAALERIAVAK